MSAEVQESSKKGKSGRTQVSLINKSAPEITPVSYPDNKPPKDATIAII